MKRWTSEELEQLAMLAGDYPFKMLVKKYIFWAAAKKYPHRTAGAIERKLKALGISTRPIGEYIYTGILCELLSVTYTTIDRWVALGYLKPQTFKGRRRFYHRVDLVQLAKSNPKLFAGTSFANLFILLEDEDLAASIAAAYPIRPGRDKRAVVCVETGRRFDSSAAAAKSVYVTKECLWQAAKRGCRAGGFYWRFQ